MKKLFVATVLISISLISLSQEIDIIIPWDENPSFSEVFPEYENENVIGIVLAESYDYYYNQQGDLMSIHNIHRKLRLNNDESINKYNKFSVSLSGVVDVIDIKARVVKPNGTVVLFDEGNIKEVKDEVSGKNQKLFAVDGIEKGDDIEYYIIRRMTGSNFGRSFFQFEYPIQKTSFSISSPSNLFYAVKGYNNYPDATATVQVDGRNRFFCQKDSIPALKSERYAYYTPRRARVEFRLDYNHARGRSQLLTWNDAAQRIFQMMYSNVDAKELDKWTKLIGLKGLSQPESVTKIEEFLKKNIFIQDFHADEFSDFKFIRTKKVSSERGIVKLYANLFKKLGVKHEIVLTVDRSVVKFDPSFQSWNYLDEYLIYLPEFDKYIHPSYTNYRIGCVDGDLTATYGLFISLIKLGEFESAVGKIKYIEPTHYKSNYDNLSITVNLNLESANARVVTVRGFKGLSGGYLGRAYETLDEERKVNMLKNLMESKAPNPVYNTLKKLDKTDIDFITDAEFLIYSDFSSSSFLEMAGDKILFNIGETIGPQVELYFEEDRKVVGEYGFNRWYYRKIRFNVPDGYKIVNPEAAVMNFIVKSGNENIYGFISTQEYTDAVYTITIDEFYNRVYTELEHFDGFKDVVNAAADFNKVVLVLEPI